MSRLYFADASGGVEVAGAERHWLLHLATGPAMAAWDVTETARLDRCAQILSMVPEVEDGEFGANYLHTGLRKAQAEDARFRAEYADHEARGIRGVANPARLNPAPIRTLISSLSMRLRIPGDLTVQCAGHEASILNLNLNTAIAAGSDPIRVAAKISGWDFTWTRGGHRAWLATIIGQGLASGMYRRGMGWEKACEWLRGDMREPVVTSHSTGEDFPDPTLAGMTWGDKWDAMTDASRWEKSLAWLRKQRPWACLSPATLGEVWFGPALTVYDVLAEDRDDRIQRAFEEADRG